MSVQKLPVIHGGRYRPICHLGNGNFGEVWLATDLVQGDDVAVKLLQPNVKLDAALLESQVLTKLRHHERIVTIRNVELAPPLPFIATDYMAKGSIGARLKAGQVSLLDAVRWIREGLDGLAFAHDEGIIHRDVKLDNFLLDANERAVLSDFGIAEDTVRGLLANPAVYVRHAAPEVFSVGTSKASDIYALGCTLHRLVTREFPFPAGETSATSALTDPHKLNAQVPMSLTRVVRTALAPDPADRYPDARRMLTALMSCQISFCWEQVADPTTLETWWADGGDGQYLLRMTENRGIYAIKVTRDKGSGHRRISGVRETTDRRSEAERLRRKLLLGLVSGGRC